jgi:hypothetical protein
MKNRSGKQDDPVVRGLADIKKLLILDLFTRGVSQSQIAKMLGVDKGNFSRAYPMRGILGKSNKKA